MTTNPADLYGRTQDALGQLRELRRTVAELSRDYAVLDASELFVDELAESITAATALVATQEGLERVDLALAAVDDAFDVALGYGSRLGRRNADQR